MLPIKRISSELKNYNTRWLRTTRIAFLTLLTFLLVTTWITCDRDPYEVLGVHREASLEQIKKAYRDLARKWHPDKSNISGDESERKFIELNRAFNTLKDPLKRSQYDRYGEVNENRQAREHYRSSTHGERVPRNSWTYHTGHGTYTFYSTSTDSFLNRKSITSHQYYNEYLKESKHRPFLIFFYVDLCRTCYMIEPAWIKITEELAHYNVGSFSLNAHREHRLAHELGVSSVPQIACLVDGHVHHHQSEISLQSLVRFIKNSLPINLITLLRTEREQDRHITTSFQKNRLSAIIIDNDEIVKLRYLLIAYSLRHQFSFGYVSKKKSEHLAISKRYKLADNSHSHILVFDEMFEKPLLHLNFDSSNFNVAQLTNRLLEKPNLRLPRLASQQKFDELCLPTQKRVETRILPVLCVVLFASVTPSAQKAREKMIQFKELNGLERDKQVVFVYIDPDKQQEFVESLLAETFVTQPSFIRETVHSSIILIERLLSDRRKAHYDWIRHQWNPKLENELDRAKIELHQYIQAYKHGSTRLTGKLVLTQLIDEEGPSLMQRIYLRSIDVVSRLAFYFASRESFSAVTILVACALLTSLFLYKSPSPTEYNSSTFTYQTTEQPAASSPKKTSTLAESSSDNDLKIIELKAETYNGMVRLLKPGYRSIIVLIDEQTKEKLLMNFKKAVWPYRRNKTLLFGYLCLDKNLKWYKTLLERVLDCDDLRVNKKNCIGTVLSLNGFKKYLRVYHAKHHEIDYYDDRTDNDGSFLGFDDREDDIEAGETAVTDNELPEVAYTADNLLDKLPIWLDKMFDGLTKRYFLDQWPEEIN